MKILYLHQYFNTPSMWGSHRSYEMARRLVKYGHDVHIVTSYMNDHKSNEGKSKINKPFNTIEDGINVHWIPVNYSNHMTFYKRIFAFIKFSIFSIPYIFKIKGDMIYATSTPLTVSIPAIVCKFFTGIKFVFEVRDLWPELPIEIGALKNPFLKFFARRLEALSYKYSDGIVALSPGMKDGIIKCGQNPKKIAVIPNLCDFERFSKDVPSIRTKFKYIKDDEPLLVFAGVFGEINNVDWIIELAQELEKLSSKSKILLIGDGKTKSEIIVKVNNLNLENRVYIEDPIAKDLMPLVLKNSTLSLITFSDLPAMRNNSANKFFDALASNTPVVINFGGWINTLVRENNCGIDCWQKSVKDAAIEINNKIQNKDWIEAAGRNAGQLGKKYFDRDLAAHNLNLILKAVLNNEKNLSKHSPEDYNLD